MKWVNMYTSFHTAVSILLLALPMPPVITAPMAFLSHHVIDRFGEQTMTDAVQKDGVLAGAQLACGLATGNVDQVLAGFLLGNGMDIIDKALMPALGNEPNTAFECHRQPGFSGAVPINEKDTIRCNVVATALAMGTLLVEP